jgi:hypothetical protein
MPTRSRRRSLSPSIPEVRVSKRANFGKEDDERLTLALTQHLTSLSSQNIRVRTFLSSVFESAFMDQLDIYGQKTYSWNHLDSTLITYGIGSYFDDQDLLQLQRVSSHWFAGLTHPDVPATQTVILNADVMIKEWLDYITYISKKRRTVNLARSFYNRHSVKFRKASHWIVRPATVNMMREIWRFCDLLGGHPGADRITHEVRLRPTRLSICFSPRQSYFANHLVAGFRNLEHLRLYPTQGLELSWYDALFNVFSDPVLSLKSLWIIPLYIPNRETDNVNIDNLGKIIRSVSVTDHIEQVVYRTGVYQVGSSWLQDVCPQLTSLGVIEEGARHTLTMQSDITWCVKTSIPDYHEPIWDIWNDTAGATGNTDEWIAGRRSQVGTGFSEGKRALKWLCMNE